MMREFMVAGLAVASLLVAGSALADGTGLGQSGQLAISSDLQLSIESTKSKPPSGPSPDATTTITIQPAADYFVTDGLSVGGFVGYTSTSQSGAKSHAIGIGPRVGYALPISDQLAFWPRLGLAYYSVSFDVAGMSVSGSKMTMDVYAPLEIIPADHFFIGIGPMFSTDLSSKAESQDYDKDTTFGVTTQLGGYF